MIQQVHDVSIVSPAGEIGDAEGREMIRKIVSLLRFDRRKIVLDLGEVDHVHFRILAELVGLVRASSMESIEIKLANLTPYTRELLRVTGVEHCFEIHDSVAEAILSFHNPLMAECEVQ